MTTDIDLKAVGCRLFAVRLELNFSHRDLGHDTQITPFVIDQIEKGKLSDEVAIPGINAMLKAMDCSVAVSHFVWHGGEMPAELAKSEVMRAAYALALAGEPVVKPRNPDFVELVDIPTPENQLDRIERLVKLLSEHRGVITPGEKLASPRFYPTIPKGATHYEDSLHTHDGAIRFYKFTEDNWLYVWGMIHEVNALGWTASELTRRQLRLTKLP